MQLPGSKTVREVALGSETCFSTNIRWLIRRDIPTILKIDERSFDQMTAEDIITNLRQRTTIGMVIEHEEEIVGWMMYEHHKNHINIIKLEVLDVKRGTGFGTLMIEKLKSKLNERKSCLTMMVDETNLIGQLFLRSNEFKAVSIEKDWAESGVDGIFFRFRDSRTE